MNALTKAVPVVVNGHDTGVSALYHEVSHVGIDPINGYVNVNIQSYLSQQARVAGMGSVLMFSRQFAKPDFDVATVLTPAEGKSVVDVVVDYLVANDEVLKDAQIVATA